MQKSVLERAGPPTFDVCVEMLERGKWRVHLDVAQAVDVLLQGYQVSIPERGTGRGRTAAGVPGERTWAWHRPWAYCCRGTR